jgi:predicted dehydrogenase
MKPLEYGTVGAGFVGPYHIDAVRRLGFVEITALASSKFETAQRKAARLFVPPSYGRKRAEFSGKAPARHCCSAMLSAGSARLSAIACRRGS